MGGIGSGNFSKPFWLCVNKHGPVAKFNRTRCWVWEGCHTDQGYGLAHWQGRQRRAHRVAYFITHGAWPDNEACHHCDTRDCVRPTHLFDGTQDNNMKDMASKGRSTHGEKHAMTKLNKQQVLVIRGARANGVPAKWLANHYKVHLMTIYKIENRLRWKCL
jgi:hypothetical protein